MHMFPGYTASIEFHESKKRDLDDGYSLWDAAGMFC
jgi:hypothetical protein